MIKLLLLNDLSREPVRKLIKGISRYQNDRGGWRFHHVPDIIRDKTDHIEQIVKMVRDLEIDAIFGQWKGLDITVAKSLGIPIVLYQRDERGHGFPIVKCGNDAVGKMAADFFKRYDDLHFSCCGFRGIVWSAERIEAFSEEIGERLVPGITISDNGEDWEALGNWLLSLPKPTGIFCCNDMNAKTLVDTCNSLGLKVPEEISVLGVDDDTFLCNITSPSISTIQLDFEGIGYRVGKFISDAVRSGICEEQLILHYPIRIVERDSTTRLQNADINIEKVIDYMDRHFSEGIGISDAIRDIPLSRRSVEQRFVQIFKGKTMHRYLMELKVEKMKELLVKTDLPIFNIALMSGFRENANINRAFRSIAGCSPKEYRQIYK